MTDQTIASPADIADKPPSIFEGGGLWRDTVFRSLLIASGALVLVLLGAGLLALVGSEGWIGASPRRLTQLFYLADPAERSFHRASATRGLDPWSRSAVASGGARRAPRG